MLYLVEIEVLTGPDEKFDLPASGRRESRHFGKNKPLPQYIRFSLFPISMNASPLPPTEENPEIGALRNKLAVVDDGNPYAFSVVDDKPVFPRQVSDGIPGGFRMEMREPVFYTNGTIFLFNIVSTTVLMALFAMFFALLWLVVALVVVLVIKLGVPKNAMPLPVMITALLVYVYIVIMISALGETVNSVLIWLVAGSAEDGDVVATITTTPRFRKRPFYVFSLLDDVGILRLEEDRLLFEGDGSSMELPYTSIERVEMVSIWWPFRVRQRHVPLWGLHLVFPAGAFHEIECITIMIRHHWTHWGNRRHMKKLAVHIREKQKPPRSEPVVNMAEIR